MTNPIIDALTWNPQNPAESVRALQTALLDLQEEWSEKLAPLRQISRNGQVYESDWNIYESDRTDATFLHFDNETPEFRGEWGNIFGNVQPIESSVRPGSSNFIFLNIDNNFLSLTTTPTIAFTRVIELVRPAKFYVFFPFLSDLISTTSLTLDLRINTVSQIAIVYSSASLSAIWRPYYFYFISNEYALGTTTLDFYFSVSGGSPDITDMAPLPNVLGAAALGIIEPYLGYAEVVYQ